MVLVEEIIKNEISECKLCGENGYLLVNKKEGSMLHYRKPVVNEKEGSKDDDSPKQTLQNNSEESEEQIGTPTIDDLLEKE